MEREAFRQRMQQYKQARESNPQLKYWDWKKYADGGEVRDNTYVAPVYKEQVFIPATGAQKIKNDYQYKYGSKSPYKGGELEIVSPEFDILTGAKAAYDTTVGLINNLSRTNRTRKIVNSFKKNLKTSDKLDVLKDNPEFGQIGTPFDYSNYIDDIFKDSQLKGIYYHGGPKGIEKFRAPKDPEFVLNKAINSGTKEQGIYFTGDKGLANYYKSSNKNGKVYKVKLNSQNPYYTNDWFAVRIRSALDKDYVYPGSITDRVRSGILKDHDAVVWHGRLGESIVFDPDQIHILGSKKDMQLFNDYIKNKHSYKNGGTIDEIPPQTTSERPITNFDPKGDPYNPTYGYNPGAGYVSNSDPLGSLYVEGALLNPVFKLAGNAVSNVARGLTKYSSKYVPEVKRTVQDKINSLFRREAEDKARTFKLYDDAIESRNRIIEDLYSNPAYMERARQIQNTYGDNHAQVYEDIINQYNTNYWNLPNPVIKQLDAKAKMQAKDAAVNRYITRRQPAGYDDFEYQINRNLTEIDYPTTRHELGHYVDFNLAKSSNPDYSNSMFAELKRDLSKQKNPLFPDKTDYYSKGTEQKSYMNTLREYMFKTGMINNIGDKVTSRQIKKAIRSLPKDMRSIEAAYLQFATPGQYTKWFNKIPLLGTYPIVNKQFQNYEEDKDKAREQR